MLLECLPGLWQAAGAGAANKLQLPLNLTAAAMTKIQVRIQARVSDVQPSGLSIGVLVDVFLVCLLPAVARPFQLQASGRLTMR